MRPKRYAAGCDAPVIESGPALVRKGLRRGGESELREPADLALCTEKSPRLSGDERIGARHPRYASYSSICDRMVLGS